MAKIDIESHSIAYSDMFFFDTNVWLLLYGTIANFQKNEQKKYSRFFSEILTKKTPIYITSLVFSEFSNVLLKRDFRQWQAETSSPQNSYKQDFVGSAAYRRSVDSITTQLRKILQLPNLMIVGDNLHILDFGNIFLDFNSIDFNDSYFTEVCLLNNYKMVTNDRDLLLVSSKIDVITALA